MAASINLQPTASATSSLSTLESEDVSASEEFHTPLASPLHHADITVDIVPSSPPDTGCDDIVKSGYHLARQLPPELKQHCQIYLEENLHLIALSLLNSLLSAGGSTPGGQLQPVYCPPASHLSLLSTILIHPDFTTRPKEPAWAEASTEALVYLRSILSIVGPVNAPFREAFHFGAHSRWSRGGSPNFEDELTQKDEGGVAAGSLKGKYMQDSVWTCGQDFFSTVGWAFNCSVLYPNRWQHWKAWLEFVLDVLEADVHERLRLDKAESEGEDSQNGLPMLRESIINSYVTQRTGRTGGVKWIVKAIFADGSQSSQPLFQEVWHREHKGLSNSSLSKRKRDKVDIDKGDFGGYMDDASAYSSQASEPPTPQKDKTITEKDGKFGLESSFAESIPLRQRLFELLSFLCFHLPDPFVDFEDLYETFVTTIRGLPLPVFSALICSSTSAINIDAQVAILSALAEILMPSSAPALMKVDRETSQINGISPAILERCFLPFPANTISAEDNAKLSLLLENLLQIYWIGGQEPLSENLEQIVRKGITARENKVKRKKATARGRGSDDDKAARDVLEASSRRLLTIADLIEATRAASDAGGDADTIVVATDDPELSFMTAPSS